MCEEKNHMKKIIANILKLPNLALVIVLFSLQSTAQTYTMSNTSVTTCSGTFYDSGGAAGNYGANQSYTKKICSNNGQSIKIDITQFDLDDYYDFLYVYDGTSTSAPLIGVYSQTAPTGASISTGTCLTFKFTSDCCWQYSGWSGTISCLAKPVCGSNPTANNVCSSATYITNLDGYCGNTSASYTADYSSDLLSDFCGTIENNSWLKFTANATSANFNIWTSNCSIGDGIQIEIFNTSDCVNFTPVSNCWNPFNDINGTVSASGLIIGHDYYMMIDGNGGDVCDFLIGAGSGIVVLPSELLSFTSNCSDNKTQIKWSTATETNSDYFIIEKSINGIEFNEIQKINAAINSTHQLNYLEYDDSNFGEIVYYRLKMFDVDGKLKISKIISSNCSKNEISIFPNPTKNKVNIIYNSNSEFVEIVISNLEGGVFLHELFNEKSINKEFDLESFPIGIYQIKIISEDQVDYKKLVIEK